MKTILVVQNIFAVQHFLREALESKGFKTLGATSGSRACEIMLKQSDTIDLVLSEYHLPDCSGYDVLMMMRHRKILKKIPIVFLSSPSSSEIEKQVNELDSTFWLNKPYRPNELFSKVRLALGSSLVS